MRIYSFNFFENRIDTIETKFQTNIKKNVS